MRDRVKLILKSGKEQSIKRYHPWIFSGAIKSFQGKPSEGDLVDVYSNHDEFLATGHYQPGSIAVRILSFTQKEINDEFWKERIEKAWNVRQSLGLADNPETNAFRFVCGEGDALPGLIIDFYDGTAVIQFHSVGMHRERERITRLLREFLGDRLHCVYDKSESSLPGRKELRTSGEYLFGSARTRMIREYGNSFEIDWEEGQKTGFYLDQRENRRLVSEYSQGRNVLNMFCYTGAFSVYALRAGASLVHSVDSSATSIALAQRNVSHNFPGDRRHQSFVMDAFSFLRNPAGAYDLIILDPPAFAKHQDALNNALQGYKKLNKKAIEIIDSGGIIFTFSCSQAVSRDNFRKSVFAAAAGTGRYVRILHQLNQPADHPVSIYHPEGEYLKGLVLLVE
jgi:23S rRNA (cytosine1962-C5)-methyltransferase